jgi:hypothetical protein
LPEWVFLVKVSRDLVMKVSTDLDPKVSRGLYLKVNGDLCPKVSRYLNPKVGTDLGFEINGDVWGNPAIERVQHYKKL